MDYKDGDFVENVHGMALGYFCEFCQITHTSKSCYHPGQDLVRVARTASAAWKASAKENRMMRRLHLDRYTTVKKHLDNEYLRRKAAEKRGDNYRDTGNSALIREAGERARADKAEKRVQELEEAIYFTLEETSLNHARARLSRALEKDT